MSCINSACTLSQRFARKILNDVSAVSNCDALNQHQRQYRYKEFQKALPEREQKEAIRSERF
jgi:hypothetical protein